jgi:hypothetical protein
MMLAPFIGWVRRKAVLITLAVAGGVLGVLPDLIGVYGFIFAPGGEHYNSAHAGDLRDHLIYIPMYALHLAVDSLTHDPDRQWYGWNVRVWLQIVLWIVNIALVVWFIRIWKKNQREESWDTGRGVIPTDGPQAPEP